MWGAKDNFTQDMTEPVWGQIEHQKNLENSEKQDFWNWMSFLGDDLMIGSIWG